MSCVIGARVQLGKSTGSVIGLRRLNLEGEDEPFAEVKWDGEQHAVHIPVRMLKVLHVDENCKSPNRLQKISKELAAELKRPDTARLDTVSICPVMSKWLDGYSIQRFVTGNEIEVILRFRVE